MGCSQTPHPPAQNAGRGGATELKLLGKSESPHSIAQRSVGIGLAAKRHRDVLASVYGVNNRSGGRGTAPLIDRPLNVHRMWPVSAFTP